MRAYFDRTRPTIIWTPVHGEYICFYSIFWDDERRNSEAPSAPGKSSSDSSCTAGTTGKAAVAAAFERESVIAGCDAPAWTSTPPLEEPWFPDPAPLLAERQVAATPPELSKRNVFLDWRGLESL